MSKTYCKLSCSGHWTTKFLRLGNLWMMKFRIPGLKGGPIVNWRTSWAFRASFSQKGEDDRWSRNFVLAASRSWIWSPWRATYLTRWPACKAMWLGNLDLFWFSYDFFYPRLVRLQLITGKTHQIRSIFRIGWVMDFLMFIRNRRTAWNCCKMVGIALKLLAGFG